MSREITPERDKRRRDISTKNRPGTEVVPREDTPEQDVAPEFEEDTLETEGEE